MPRIAYVSCGLTELDLKPVKDICQFLVTASCNIEWAPHPAYWEFYRNLESAIERCDAFIAVFGRERECSTWLAHEFDYALTLRRHRFRQRPIIFGVHINGCNIPGAYRQAEGEIEWLSRPEDYPMLLNVSPRSDYTSLTD